MNTLIYHYNIIDNGKHVECNLLGWRTALAHARERTSDLFNQNKQIEILCIETGEITIIQKARSAVISGTT